MTGDDRYYEQSEFWGKEPSLADAERIQAIIALIPYDVSSILDAGCGDGILVNRLGNEYGEVVGVDNSEAGLAHVRGTKMRGSVDSLPFSDNAFDLVICSEVLEHLPQEVYRKTKKEIQRVAKKYIIISVPNNEPIEQSFAKCSECECTYHIFRHMHSFDRKQMDTIFENYRIKESSLCGPLLKDYNGFLLRVKRFWGSGWADSSNALCPQCGGNKHVESRRNIFTLAVGLLNRLVPHRKRKTWIIALYEKKGTSH